MATPEYSSGHATQPQRRVAPMESTSPPRTWRTPVAIGLLLLAALPWWRDERVAKISDSATLAVRGAQSAAFHAGAAVHDEPPLLPIESVRLGQRIAAENPELVSDAARGESELYKVPEPDENTARKLVMRLTKPDGYRLEFELLRSPDWIAAHGAVPGHSIDVELAEMGVSGPALVMADEACPRLEPGSGSLVTGRFRHTVPDGTVVVEFVGDCGAAQVGGDAGAAQVGVRRLAPLLDPAAPIVDRVEGTAHHPFWSDDRQAFVPAGALAVGERVRTVTGDRLREANVLARPGPTEVYNLEVHGQHVYFVGTVGVLVHNACAGNYVYQLVDDQGTPVYYGIADGAANLRRRLADHAMKETGRFKGQQVLAEGLTRAEAKTLESHLIKNGLQYGDDLLNQKVSTTIPLARLVPVQTPAVTHLPPWPRK